MEHLTLIDQWKSVDPACGHRWDTTVTYAQLRDEGRPGAGAADGDEVAARRRDIDAMTDSG
jgi:hypothetical protein